MRNELHPKQPQSAFWNCVDTAYGKQSAIPFGESTQHEREEWHHLVQAVETNTDLNEYRRVKTNASTDLNEYRRKTNASTDLNEYRRKTNATTDLNEKRGLIGIRHSFALHKSLTTPPESQWKRQFGCFGTRQGRKPRDRSDPSPSSYASSPTSTKTSAPASRRK